MKFQTWSINVSGLFCWCVWHSLLICCQLWSIDVMLNLYIVVVPDLVSWWSARPDLFMWCQTWSIDVLPDLVYLCGARPDLLMLCQTWSIDVEPDLIYWCGTRPVLLMWCQTWYIDGMPDLVYWCGVTVLGLSIVFVGRSDGLVGPQRHWPLVQPLVLLLVRPSTVQWRLTGHSRARTGSPDRTVVPGTAPVDIIAKLISITCYLQSFREYSLIIWTLRISSYEAIFCSCSLQQYLWKHVKVF